MSKRVLSLVARLAVQVIFLCVGLAPLCWWLYLDLVRLWCWMGLPAGMANETAGFAACLFGVALGFGLLMGAIFCAAELVYDK